MTEKYKVTQDFMNELIEWRDEYDLDAKIGSIFAFVDGRNIQNIPNVIDVWWTNTDNPIENNNRLIAIIQWLNGEDVFEVEKPHMFVVRSIRATSMGKHGYLFDLTSIDGVPVPSFGTQSVLFAAKFDSREAAEAWVTTGYKVVEIDEEYQEVD